MTWGHPGAKTPIIGSLVFYMGFFNWRANLDISNPLLAGVQVRGVARSAGVWAGEIAMHRVSDGGCMYSAVIGVPSVHGTKHAQHNTDAQILRMFMLKRNAVTRI